MRIILNGKPEDVAETETAAELIARLGLAGKRLALEVNREVLPRSRHGSYRLRPDDRIEIVQAIGGG
jgi:thiamine biosynthesis protein ThiS